MNTETLPVYRKGSIRYAITPDGKVRPIGYRTAFQRTYRNSIPALPEGLKAGRYLGKVSKVDATELDFEGIAEFTTEKGLTRLSSEITQPSA